MSRYVLTLISVSLNSAPQISIQIPLNKACLYSEIFFRWGAEHIESTWNIKSGFVGPCVCVWVTKIANCYKIVNNGQISNKLGARTLGARSGGSKNVTYREQTT